jgi:molybdopterin-guanine dinucleotide biosynthesis protein
MFGLFKKTYSIDFNERNKEQFTTLLTEIYEILRDSAYSAQANWVKQILSTVQKEDKDMFKEKVISAELLGGAGSVVDVWIEDEEKMKRLDSLMNSFLELTIKSGLNHKAVKSRIIKK